MAPSYVQFIELCHFGSRQFEIPNFIVSFQRFNLLELIFVLSMILSKIKIFIKIIIAASLKHMRFTVGYFSNISLFNWKQDSLKPFRHWVNYVVSFISLNEFYEILISYTTCIWKHIIIRNNLSAYILQTLSFNSSRCYRFANQCPATLNMPS